MRVIQSLTGNARDFQYHYKPDFMDIAGKQQ